MVMNWLVDAIVEVVMMLSKLLPERVTTGSTFESFDEERSFRLGPSPSPHKLMASETSRRVPYHGVSGWTLRSGHPRKAIAVPNPQCACLAKRSEAED